MFVCSGCKKRIWFAKPKGGMCAKCYAVFAEHSRRKAAVSAEYTALLNKFNAFRVSDMTLRQFDQFYKTGMALLDFLPQIVVKPHERIWDERHDLWHENVINKLVEQCCRFGKWAAAYDAIERAMALDVYRSAHLTKLLRLISDREIAAGRVEAYIKRFGGEMKKSELTKIEPTIDADMRKWLCSKYRGIGVVKRGGADVVRMRRSS